MGARAVLRDIAGRRVGVIKFDGDHRGTQVKPEFGGVRCVGVVLQACDLGLLIVAASIQSEM